MNELDELLKAADPLASAVLKTPAAGHLHPLTELTMSEPLPAKPRMRKRRAAIIAGLSIVVIGVPTAAVAVNGGIHTGIFGKAGDTETHPGEEILNLSDPGIVAIVKEEIAKVPIPAGTNLNKVLALYPIPLDHGAGSVGQRRVIINGVQGQAQCLWYEDWLGG